jgi:hypothetical protein
MLNLSINSNIFLCVARISRYIYSVRYSSAVSHNHGRPWTYYQWIRGHYCSSFTGKLRGPYCGHPYCLAVAADSVVKWNTITWARQVAEPGAHVSTIIPWYDLTFLKAVNGSNLNQLTKSFNILCIYTYVGCAIALNCCISYPNVNLLSALLQNWSVFN